MSIPRCKHTSHRGKAKQRYRSVEHAERIAERRGWAVQVYPCPTGQKHYHISHQKENAS